MAGPRPEPAVAGGYPGTGNAVGYGAGAYGAGSSAPPSPAAELQPGPSTTRWDADIDPVMQERLAREAKRVYHDVPWYETWFGIVVVTFLIWPLGLYCLWRSAVPTTKQKWAVTAGLAALIAFNVVLVILEAMAAMSSMPPMPPP